MITLDSPPQDAKYRCHWTAPLAIDPFDHNNVYYGCNVIFKTTNAGQSWQVTSPDLSTQDPSKIKSSGGIVGDNLGQFAPEVVFAIAPSEVEKGLIWAGTTTAKIWYTRDGGAKWNDVSKNVSGMPPLAVVSKIEPSHFKRRYGVRGRGRAPPRQSRAVHLQDHRLRRHMEAREWRPAEHASVVVREGRPPRIRTSRG